MYNECVVILPFTGDYSVMEAGGSIVADHAYHRLILFVGFLHLVVSVDGRGFIVAVGSGNRPSSARIGRQVERVHLMRGGRGQL